MKGGAVAPQNTFLDNILRRSNELQLTFVIGNAALNHYPIIYSSESFTKATGYSRGDVLHRIVTCEFLWGALTSKETQKKIQGTIDAKTIMQTEIVLYKKNKKPCWFLYQISPIKNDEDEVILFLITFKDISHLKDPIEEPTVKKWSRLVEKSLAKQRIDLSKSSDNARSVFLQLAKKDTNKKQKLAQLMTTSAMNVQYSWEGTKIPRFTVFHYSLFKTIWDWIILILTLYTAVVAPFVVSFQFSSLDLVIFNIIVDTIFVCDVMLNFKTTYSSKEGEIVYDSKMIVKNYVRSWFAVDFVAALPYGVFNLAYPDGGWIEIINVIKVIRLIRLLRVARKLDHYLKFGAMTLVLWLFMFCLCAHWMACIWYVIAIHYDKPQKPGSWVFYLSEVTNQPYSFKNGNVVKGTGPTIASAYMSALYYTMSSLTTCGFGNIAPNTTAEKIFGCITMLLGCLLYAFIFGQVTSIIQQLQKPSSDYHQKLDSIRRFTKLYTVPQEIAGRLVDYYMTTWATNKGLDIDEVLKVFPQDLQADVSLQIHKVVFETMPEFKNASSAALRSISRHFWTLRSAPGARVIQQGEVLNCLFFVERGSLEIKRGDQIVGILGTGDVFGSDIKCENRGERAMYDIHTLTYSDLHCVKMDSLSNALQLFPDFFKTFKKELSYSFQVGKQMRVYGSGGKEYLVWNNNAEEETSFMEGKLDAESLTNSHDQAMVDGHYSMDHLHRNRSTIRSHASIEQDVIANKMDIFTELNILRDDVKNSIREVHTKINNFDDKINVILNLLQKQNNQSASGTDETSRTNDKKTSQDQSQTKLVQSSSNQNKNDTLQNPPGSTNERKPSNSTQSKSNKQSQNETSTPSDIESFSSDKEAKPTKKENSSSGKEATISKKDPSNSSKNSNKINKISSNVLQKILQTDEPTVRVVKPKMSKPVMNKPKQQTSVADDLEALERELEEIGVPDKNFNKTFQRNAQKTKAAKRFTTKS